jgi:hypothetical protein
MADTQIGNVHGFPATSLGVGSGNRPNLNGSTGVDSSNSVFNTNITTIAAKRARLAVINAAIYTNSMLNTMTVNDMDYAIRLADNANSIKQ